MANEGLVHDNKIPLKSESESANQEGSPSIFSDMITSLSRNGEYSLGDMISRDLLVFLLLAGAIISTLGVIGISAIIHLSLAFICIVSLIRIRWRNRAFHNSDLRWLIVPMAILILGEISPYWTLPQTYDMANHLQAANRFLGRWSWEPYAQGMEFAFRPSVVSGIASIELFLTGRQTKAPLTAFALILGTGWLVQHLSERYAGTRLGWLAAITFLTFPVVVENGRTILLDVAVTGALIIVLLQLLESKDLGINRGTGIIIGICCALVGLVKYLFFYVGPWSVVILLLANKREQGKFVAQGWALATAPFWLTNLVLRGNPIAPMQSQLQGVEMSLNNEIVCTYQWERCNYDLNAMTLEYLAEWGSIIALCFAAIGLIVLLRHHRIEVLLIAGIIAPAIVLHGIILDFGYPRYQIPWLALGAICVPSAFIGFNEIIDKFGTQRIVNFRPLMALILMAVLVIPTAQGYSEKYEQTEVIQYRATWQMSQLDAYASMYDLIPTDATILAGQDIDVGMRSGIETFRFGDAENPIRDSITMVDATHIFTSQSYGRFAWEKEALILLGAPIDAIDGRLIGNSLTALWVVNNSRLETNPLVTDLLHNNQSAHTIHGDTILLVEGAIWDVPEGLRVQSIIQVENEDSNYQAVRLVVGVASSAVIICGTVEACGQEVLEVPEAGQWFVQLGVLN